MVYPTFLVYKFKEVALFFLKIKRNVFCLVFSYFLQVLNRMNIAKHILKLSRHSWDRGNSTLVGISVRLQSVIVQTNSSNG